MKKALLKIVSIICVMTVISVIPVFATDNEHSTGLLIESTAPSVLRTLRNSLGCYATHNGEKGQIPPHLDKPILYVPDSATVADIKVNPEAVSVEGLLDDDKLYTGALITIKDMTINKMPDYEAHIVICGDAIGSNSNFGDGKVDILDLVATRDFIINSKNNEATTLSHYAMDLSSDYKIDIEDLVFMRSMIIYNVK